MANPQADPRAASYEQDLEYCKGKPVRRQQTGTQAAQGALAGGAVGARRGAITGSLSKNVPMGRGAALGGALGALAGGAYGAYQGDQQYQTALWSCMRQLGHPSVLTPVSTPAARHRPTAAGGDGAGARSPARGASCAPAEPPVQPREVHIAKENASLA